IDNDDITIDELMEYIPGPDFPTGAIINGRAGIVQAYRTGRGRIYIRAKAEVEVDAKTGRETIIVHEIPYQLNKARLIERIAELVKEKKIEGISELRDESDKDGLRIVIEVKRNESGEVLLNNLYAQTQLQNVFGINIVALDDGQPKILNLRELIDAFIRHRREVVTRRTVYLLRKARERGHILEGLAVAIANNDEVISLLNNLYAQPQLQNVSGINIVALDDGQPKILNLRELIDAFIRHRREVVTRRTVYLLRKARERGHILEGLAVAIANIDEVISLI